MTNRPYPPEFWEVYLKAKEQAEQTQAWNICEMHRQFAVEQSGISSEFESRINNAIEQEQLQIFYELYKQMVISCVMQ